MRNLYKGSITSINKSNRQATILINTDRDEFKSILDGNSYSTVIQLIFDETLGVPLLSNANKSNIISATPSTDESGNINITLVLLLGSTVDINRISTEDKLTISIDSGDEVSEVHELLTDVADKVDSTASELTLVQESNDIKSKLGDTQSVLDSINGDELEVQLPSDYATSTEVLDVKSIVASIQSGMLTEEDKSEILSAIYSQNPNLTPITDRLDNVDYGLEALKGKLAKESSLISASNITNNNISELIDIVKGISTSMYKGLPVRYLEGINVTLAPNEYSLWSEPLTESVTINKGVGVPSLYNNYLVRFTIDPSASGVRATFKNWPINWYGGNIPVWTAGNTYEISIVDGLALWAEYEP